MRLNSESIETILERFDRRDDADADYVMAHWRESVDVYEHDGSMLDLDNIVRLETVLGDRIGYDAYHRINSTMEDLGEWLEQGLLVREASDGEAILPGHAYLPPGDRHLRVIRDGARWRCRIDDGAPVNRHRPAVDVLFRSVAQNAGANAVAAILTGMGDDGARGLLELRQAGAATLVQDEATSVVWGMPGAAYRLGAAQEVVPLDRIAGRLLELAGARPLAATG